MVVEERPGGTVAVGEMPPQATGSPHLGERLRTLRRARALSQAELGGGRLSKSFISQVESGKSSLSPESAAYLAARLDVAITALLPDRDSALRGQYLLRALEAAVSSGDGIRAHALVDEARPLALLTPERARFHRLVGELLLRDGDPEGALVEVRTSIQMLGPRDSGEEAVRAHNLAGRAHVAATRFPAALQYFEHAARIGAPPHIPAGLLATVHRNIGNAHAHLGDTAGAISAYETARGEAAAAEDLRGLALAYMGIGEAARQRGDYAEGIAAAERAISLLERLELRTFSVQLLHNIGLAQADSGDLEAAHRTQLLAYETASAMSETRTAGYALERLSMLDTRAGDGQSGLARADEAMAAAGEAGDDGLLALALVARAEALDALGRSDEAVAAADDARATAAHVGLLEHRQVLLRCGALYRVRGDAVSAAAAFEEAARLPSR